MSNPTLYQATITKVPTERLFEFYRLMSENGFKSFCLWSYSEWPEEFKEPAKITNYPGPTK